MLPHRKLPPSHLPVLAAWDETPGLRALRIGASPELAVRYRTPGQYLEVEDEGGMRGYFALASAPGSEHLEILVRRGIGLSEAVCALVPGDRLRVLDVLGGGFPLREQRRRHLLLVAVGSGIAPLRALLQEAMSSRGEYGEIALYYGQRSEAELAYQGEYAAWQRAGVHLVTVLSGRRGGSDRRRYVQHHLEQAPPEFIGADTAAFLCGMDTMVEETTAILRRKGLAPARIFVNY